MPKLQTSSNFQHFLRCKFGKLEEELVQAHLQGLRSLRNGGFAYGFSQRQPERNVALRHLARKEGSLETKDQELSEVWNQQRLFETGIESTLDFQDMPESRENTSLPVSAENTSLSQAACAGQYPQNVTMRFFEPMGAQSPQGCPERNVKQPQFEGADDGILHQSRMASSEDASALRGGQSDISRHHRPEEAGRAEVSAEASDTETVNTSDTGQKKEDDAGLVSLASQGGRVSTLRFEESEESQEFLSPIGNADQAEEDLDRPDLKQLVLRLQWQDSELVKNTRRKSRFGQKLNETLDGIRRTKNKKRVSTRSQVSTKTSSESEATTRLLCIINPFSRAWINWEMFGMMLLVHDIVLVPMQVFNLKQTLVLQTLKWLTIIYWTLTFFLTFCVTYQRKSEAGFVTDHRQIFLHYVKGWFMLDVCLVGSDWAGVAIEIMIDTSDSGLGNARMARMARLGRLFRFIRLLRLMRVAEMWQQVESLINSEYLSICFLMSCNMVAILVLAHLAACIWFGIGDANEGTSWLQPLELHKIPVSEQYVHSLGWSLSTLLGASITEPYVPQTMVEYTCALFILITGTIAVSLVFSSTTAAMTRLQQLKSEDRDATFKLKQFLRQNCITGNLEARLVRYVNIAKSVHAKRIAIGQVSLLNLLSGPLRLELQLELHAPHLTSHQFFDLYYTTNAGAMSELCLTAVGFVYLGRDDTLFRTFSQANHMYFLVGGVMAYRRAKGAKNTRHTVKIDKHSNFCESAIWMCWVHRGGMKALIESQVLALDVIAFSDITESHHDVFLESCHYAEKYLLLLKQEMQENGYIWDVPSEMMYSGKHKHAGHTTMEDPNGFLNILKEAEEVTAELMDDQSDSDSDDERLLKSALARSGSSANLGSISNKAGLSSRRKVSDSMTSLASQQFTRTSSRTC